MGSGLSGQSARVKTPKKTNASIPIIRLRRRMPNETFARPASRGKECLASVILPVFSPPNKPCQRTAESVTCGMNHSERFLREHQELTRRHFIRLGVAGAAAFGLGPSTMRGGAVAPELQTVIEKLEPYFTPQEKFRDVSRGKPL